MAREIRTNNPTLRINYSLRTGRVLSPVFFPASSPSIDEFIPISEDDDDDDQDDHESRKHLVLLQLALCTFLDSAIGERAVSSHALVARDPD